MAYTGTVCKAPHEGWTASPCTNSESRDALRILVVLVVLVILDVLDDLADADLDYLDDLDELVELDDDVGVMMHSRDTSTTTIEQRNETNVVMWCARRKHMATDTVCKGPHQRCTANLYTTGESRDALPNRYNARQRHVDKRLTSSATKRAVLMWSARRDNTAYTGATCKAPHQRCTAIPDANGKSRGALPHT
jgi:hypothetical protein